MLLWLGSRSPPDAAGQPVAGEAIADRAPPGWRSMVVLGPPDGSMRGPVSASPCSDEAEESDFFVAAALGDAMIGDPRPVERIAACLVFSNPVAGREAEFNDWYTCRHLPDVLGVEGYLAAQRFSLAAPVGMQAPCWRYLAVYEVDYARYDAAMADVAERSGTALMPISEAAQRPLTAHFLLPTGKRLLAGCPAGS